MIAHLLRFNGHVDKVKNFEKQSYRNCSPRTYMRVESVIEVGDFGGSTEYIAESNEEVPRE